MESVRLRSGPEMSFAGATDTTVFTKLLSCSEIYQNRGHTAVVQNYEMENINKGDLFKM